MSDLISRQAALDALNERCESECEYSKKQRSVMCNACYLGSAKEVVENLPTIDPAENGGCLGCQYERLGQWRMKELDKFRKYEVVCSECGAKYIGNYDAYDEPCEFNYCPNCGARMDIE